MYKVDDIVWVNLDSNDYFAEDVDCDLNDLVAFKSKITQVNKDKTFDIEVYNNGDSDEPDVIADLEKVNPTNFFQSEEDANNSIEKCKTEINAKLKPINKEFNKAIKALLKANELAKYAGFEDLFSAEKYLDSYLFSAMETSGWNTSSFNC